MNRDALQRVSVQRRREAAALLRAGFYPGAYYLVGYAVECALKACIAKQTARYDFPNKRLAQQAWTHNLEELIGLAGLGPDLLRDRKASPKLSINWAITKDWDEGSRYDVTITRAQARDLYSACTARQNGVLTWIRQRW
jgi:HEPN domain-containing protein